MAERELMEQFFTLIQTVNRYMRAGQFDQDPHQENQQITRVQWLILRHLHRREERTIGQLAEHLNVRSSTMSQMIDRLEKAGLVFRSMHATDARTRMVHLTADGLKTIQQMEARWIETLTEPFEQLTPEEHQTLVGLLKKLTDHLPKRGEK